MPYIGKSPGNGVRQRYIYAATAGQTSFSGNDSAGISLVYDDPSYLDVYQNGVLLKPVTDYASTTGTSVVLVTGATTDDVVEMITYDTFAIADTVSAKDGGSFGGAVTINGNATITGNLNVSGTGAGAAGVASASSSGTAISIDSSNRVTMPLQPSFFAQPSTAQNNIGVTDGTSVVIALGTERYDVGANFASNTFTAPITGKYLLSATCYYLSMDSLSTYNAFYITTSNRLYFQLIAPPRDHATSAGFDLPYWSFNHAVVADMDVNDTAVIKFAQYGGTIQADIQTETNFSGILIG